MSVSPQIRSDAPAPAPVRTPFLHRVAHLFAHQGFKAAPVRALFRTGLWALCVATRSSPRFRLTAEGSEWMKVPSDLRYTSVCAFVLRDHTEPELRHLHQFIKPGSVFVDAGANVGLYTLKAARIVGSAGQVVAIEPGSAAATQLTANIALNADKRDFAPVTVIREALADQVGTAVLHHVSVGDDPQAFSLLADRTSSGGETVSVTTLDALVERLGMTRIDCVKMDVEGAEPLLVDGARLSLTRFRPIVLFEANSTILERRGDRNDGCWQKLEVLGYRFHRLIKGVLTPLDHMPDEWCNIIAIHPDGPQAG